MRELDIKNKKILYELDKNSRMPAAELARKTGMSKEVVHYRINHLKDRGYIKKFYTIINTAKLGYVSHKIYFQFQNLNKEKEKELLNYLQVHPKIFWIATASGKWDLMLGAWAKNIMDFNDNVMQDILNKFSNYILNKEIAITKDNIQQNRRWFYPNCDARPITSYVGGEPVESKLDHTDLEILKILANNARLPIGTIAKKIKSTPSIVNYRLKKLIDKEIIQSFRLGVDLYKFNYEFCKAFIYLRNPSIQKQLELINYCKLRRQILNIVTCVGTWDLEIEFEVENFEKFHAIMKDLREKYGDIIKNYESIVISKEQRVDYIPGCYPQIT